MANTNAPYGFRLWTRLNAGTGAAPLAPGFYPGASPGGPIAFPSAATLKVGDPVHVSLGLGYIAVGTNAIYGVLDSPVPGWGETATQRHYPDILPAEDQTVWRCQSIGTVNVTAGLIGMASRKYRIGGTTSGYQGVNMTIATAGYGPIQVVGLAPGSAFGTYAEVLVVFTRGAFYGQP